MDDLLTTDFATYAGRRTRPFALPLTLAGAGCHHGSRRCWLCPALAEAYAASMRWAAGILFEDWPENPIDYEVLHAHSA